jgi:hypothetical protein
MAACHVQLPRWPFGSVRTMDVSATAQQTYLRLQQLRQWPWSVFDLRRGAPPASHAHAALHIKYGRVYACALVCLDSECVSMCVFLCMYVCMCVRDCVCA